MANNSTIRVFDTDLIVPLYEIYFTRDERKKIRDYRPKNRLISGGEVVPGEEDGYFGSSYSYLNC